MVELLVGETIASGGLDLEDGGFHLTTQSGLVLIFMGDFRLGVFKTEDTNIH